jgi:hypothetical protein
MRTEGCPLDLVPISFDIRTNRVGKTAVLRESVYGVALACLLSNLQMPMTGLDHRSSEVIDFSTDFPVRDTIGGRTDQVESIIKILFDSDFLQISYSEIAFFNFGDHI